MEGQLCDVVGFSSKHVPDPSPLPSHENGFQVLLMTLRKYTVHCSFSFKMVFGQNSFLINNSQFLCVED